MTQTADLPTLLGDWVAARSVARGLPAPVADRGGWRVDTRSDVEDCRWVFPQVTEELSELGAAIARPKKLIKLCGSVDQLTGALPAGWDVSATGAFMRFSGAFDRPDLRPGYLLECEQNGDVAYARILYQGQVVATGYGAATDRAFVFDRILVDPAHRRRGLASALVAALSRGALRDRHSVLLVASVMGVPLYERLGWDILSPYSTAEFVGAAP